MKVRFYGKLVDLFGNERDIAVEGACTVAELRHQLAQEHPNAAESLQHRRVRACIGDEFIRDADVVPDGAVLEFLAPVSGG